MPDPLKGKIITDLAKVDWRYSVVYTKDIKSAAEGLIKYHEIKIEIEITLLESRILDKQSIYSMIQYINDEYEAINAIEHWLEDAI